MGAVISAVLSWLFGVFARLFVVISQHFLATKIVLVTFFMIVFPVILNNLVYEILEGVFSVINNIAVSQDIPVIGSVISFSGLAGWFLSTMKIPESFSVVVSAIATSFVLRSIPFVRW